MGKTAVKEGISVKKSALVVTPQLKYARELFKMQCAKIEVMTDEIALREATALTKNPRQLIESGLFAMENGENIPCLLIMALQGNKFIFAIKEVNAIKVDTSVVVLKTSVDYGITQEYSIEKYNTITLGTFPMVDGSYNFKTCRIESGKIAYNGDILNMSSFQPSTGKNASNKMAIVRNNLTAEQYAEIVKLCKAQLKLHSAKQLEKIEKFAKK